VCNVSVFSTAARELGLESISYQRQGIDLFDGRVFNAEDPISYLNDQSIHQDFSIAEIPLAPSRALSS
jgi:bicarbonate transport system ATP-binding protein